MRSLSIDLLRALNAAEPPRSGLAEGARSTPVRDLRSLALECGAGRPQVTRCLRRLAELDYVRLHEDSVSPGARFDFLNAAKLRAAIGNSPHPVEITVADACESTNSALLAQPPVERVLRVPRFLIAEEQTAGKGRRGRKWLSELGGAITCSLGVQFGAPPRQLSGLSLAAGVAVARALRAAGAAEVSLKWPNDLMLGHAKLGGILVETRASRGSVAAVIGIGINHTAQPRLGERLRRKVTALAQCLDPLPSRNAIAGGIVRELLAALEEFQAQGVDAIRSEWEALHGYAGHRLRVRLADGRVVAGLAGGLDEDGGLLLRTRAGVTSIASGQVISARLA